MHEAPPLSLDEARAALTRDLDRLARSFFRIACVIGALMVVGNLIPFQSIGSELGYVNSVLRALPSTMVTAALLVVAARILSRWFLRAVHADLLQRGQLVPASLNGSTATLSELFKTEGSTNNRLGGVVAAFGAVVRAWVPTRSVRYSFAINGREQSGCTGALFVNQQPLVGRGGTYWVLADPVRPDRGHWLVRVDLPSI